MKKRIMLGAFLSVVLAASAVFDVQAGFPRRELPATDSYVYVSLGQTFIAVPAPPPYIFSRSVRAEDIGIDSFLSLNEIKYWDGRFFITNGASLVVLDADFNLLAELTGIHVDGSFEAFRTLDGIAVAPNGDIYVAEPAAGRLIHFDADLNLVRTLGRPPGLQVADDVPYEPLKVAVDYFGRIYVISANIFQGIVEINPDGTFNRFFGTVQVPVTAQEVFWRTFRTAAQRMRGALWLPMNYTNLAVDSQGFVFASLTNEPRAMMLNGRGQNIMRRVNDEQAVGSPYVMGFGGRVQVTVNMTQVSVTDFGVYYLFDRNASRVFAYDEDGFHLFAFGGSGTREGSLSLVDGMTLTPGGIVFADRGNRSLEVFERTAYGEAILAAARAQYQADFVLAAAYFRDVLDINPHFQYSHMALGRYYYRTHQFEQAMFHFQRAQFVAGYSSAYSRIRTDNMHARANFILLAVVLIVFAAIGLQVRRAVRQYRTEKRGVAA